MKRLLSVFMSVFIVLSFSFTVCADESLDEIVLDDELEYTESESAEYPEGSADSGSLDWLDLLPSPDDLPLSTESSEPLLQPATTQSDVSLSSAGDIALYDVTYGGAWSTSVSDYFEGYILTNSPFDHYFAVRQSQYFYTLYCGNIKFANGYYTGNNLTQVAYNTQNSQYNEYVSVSKGVSLNYSAGDGIFYSDLEGGSSYASVTVVRFVCVVGVVLVVLLIVRLFARFFK